MISPIESLKNPILADAQMGDLNEMETGLKQDTSTMDQMMTQNKMEEGMNAPLQRQVRKLNVASPRIIPGQIEVLERGQLFNQEKLIATHENYASLKTALMESKWGIRKNSDLMVKVKDSLTVLSNLLQEEIGPITENTEADFLKRTRKIERAYMRSMHQCQNYIAKRNPSTESGQTRKMMVEKTLNQLTGEFDAFKGTIEASLAAHKSGEAPIAETETFTYFLYNVRAQKMDLTAASGGATASAKKVTINGTKYFYKDEERISSTEIATDICKRIAAGSADMKEDQLGPEEKVARLITQFTEMAERVNPIKYAEYLAAINKENNDITEDELYNALMNVYDDLVEDEIISEKEKAVANELIDTLTHNRRLEDYSIQLRDLNKTKNNPMAVQKTVDEATEGIKKLKAKIKAHKDKQAEHKKLTDTYATMAGKRFTNKVINTNGIHQGVNLSLRNVATSRVANMMGCGNVVAESKSTIRKTESGAIKRGNLMAVARCNVNPEELETTIKEMRKNLNISGKMNGIKINMTPTCAQKLTNLQMLDNLMGQLDRHTGNFFIDFKVVGNEIYITDIQGIDNDMCLGKVSKNDMIKGRNRMGGLFNGSDKLLEHMDKTTADWIENATMEQLRQEIVDCDVTIEEFNYLEERLNTLKEYVRAQRQSSAKMNNGVSDFDLSNEQDWKNCGTLNNILNYRSQKKLVGVAKMLDFLIGEGNKVQLTSRQQNNLSEEQALQLRTYLEEMRQIHINDLPAAQS